MLSGKSAILIYIKPSTELLNNGPTLNATKRAFCLMYFFNNTGKRKVPSELKIQMTQEYHTSGSVKGLGVRPSPLPTRLFLKIPC